MKFLFIPFVLFSSFYLMHSQEDLTNPIVGTWTGKVFGQKDETTAGKTFYKFLGVPYAEPPIGKLRFKDPVSKKPWRGMLDSTEFPEICVQSQFIPDSSPIVAGSEDCLYLNIYTTSLGAPSELKPVMFWIHEGRFIVGDSNEKVNPELILDEDVLVVTVHFRLGPFGFLALEDNPKLPGNIGLKDQQEALQWVNKNIIFFGGDPSRVTLFGLDAGATSAHAHILSPRIQKLFNGAILQSGSALMGYVQLFLEKRVQKESQRFIESIDCNVSDVVECLQTKDVETLVRLASTENLADLNFWIVQDSSSLSPALPFDPLQQLVQGNFKKVPIIVGNSKDDYGLFLIFNPGVKLGSEENSDTALMTGLGLATKNVTEEEKRIVKVMQRFYLSERSFDENEKNLSEMATDSWFGSPVAEISKLHGKVAPVFPYVLNERCTELGLTSLYGYSKDYGVSHNDDLNCLFKPNSNLGKVTDSGKATSKTFVQSFTNFAKFQDPSPQNFEPTWASGEIMFFQSKSGVYKKSKQYENHLTRMLLWDKMFWKSMEEKANVIKTRYF